MEWSDHWVWFAGAIVLAILEILAPGYILLGFALAAGVIGVGLWMGGGIGAFLATSLPVTLVVTAVVAIVIWLLLRKVFGVRGGSVKVWDTDINEN